MAVLEPMRPNIPPGLPSLGSPRSGSILTRILLMLAAGYCPAQAVSVEPRAPTVEDGRAPAAEARSGVLQPVPRPNLEYADDAVRFALQEARELLDSLRAKPGAGSGELANAFGETGLLYHAHLAFEAAKACYLNAALLAPDDFRWPYYVAYLHQQNGRLDQAAAYYSEALALNPDWDAARLRLGQIRLEQGQWDRAGAVLDRLAGVPAFRGAALFGAGRLAYARREFERARDLLEEALAVSPQASRIHYTLALTYRALGDLEKARYHLSRRGDAEPVFPDPLIADLEALTTGQRTTFHSAMNAVYQKQYALAVRIFREGLRRDPQNLDARVSLARSLYLGGDREGAEAELKAVLEVASERPLANFLLGALLQEDGLTDQAIARFRATLRVEPDHPGANFLMANSLMRRGDYAGAARHYGLSLLREPDNGHARLREVLALIKARAPHRELKKKLETAHARAPGDPAVTFLLAALLAASPDEVVRDGKRALDLAGPLYGADPTAAKAELLAMAYAEVGDFQKAEALQNRAVRMALAANSLALIPGFMENLSRFRAEQACRAPWGVQGPPLHLPPARAKGVFKDYPAESPY